MVRKEAKKLGLPRYTTGSPCPQGHNGERRTSNGCCCQCELDWGRANKDRVRKTAKEWRRSNPHKHCASEGKRRTLKRGGIVTDSDKKYVDALYGVAAWLRKNGIDVHVDHIIPLSKGGKHAVGNLQLLEASVNLMKGGQIGYIRR